MNHPARLALVIVELWPTTVVERPVADAKACRPAD